MNLTVPETDGLVCELQLHFHEIHELKVCHVRPRRRSVSFKLNTVISIHLTRDHPHLP